MRKLVKGAIEMVYDNYNWLVIGFCPTERPSEAIFSIVMPPGRVTLCFLQGAGLSDPAKRLQGTGHVGAEHSALRCRPSRCQSA